MVFSKLGKVQTQVKIPFETFFFPPPIAVEPTGDGM
jgi:hypothetical protein